MLKNIEADIVLLGAGLVGLTLANLCAKNGFKVAVVEPKKTVWQWESHSHDSRSFAISRASQTLFEKLDLWPSMVTLGVMPYQHMVVWDALGYGEIEFNAEAICEPDLGHIIENRVMMKVLWEAAEQNPNIALFSPHTPVSLHQELDKIIITLDNEYELAAKLCVGAEGANSWVRRTVGIETTLKDYHQSALVTNVITEKSHNHTAWQRFLPEGPLAFLPLQALNMSSIVWTASVEKIENLILLSEKEFCEELGYHFDFRLGRIQSAAPRFHFPLTRMHAKHYIGNRIVLVGDAAHVIHPLAGQGVNLGLADVAALVKVLSDAKEKEIDIAHPLILRKYERQRKSEVFKMMAGMDFLNKLFGLRSTAAVSLRSIGLNATNKCEWLKKKLIVEAMGY